MKTLVVYFSRSGRTKGVAEQIAAETGGTLYEIRTEKTYPKNYFAAILAARREFSSQERPALTGEPVADFESYERVLIGFPIWFGTCPMAVISFLERYDFNGKSVYPFCTSSMGGCAKAKADIEKACKGEVHNGIKANRIDKDKITQWLEK